MNTYDVVLKVGSTLSFFIYYCYYSREVGLVLVKIFHFIAFSNVSDLYKYTEWDWDDVKLMTF